MSIKNYLALFEARITFALVPAGLVTDLDCTAVALLCVVDTAGFL